MKILAFAAGVLLPVAVAVFLGGGLPEPESAPTAATTAPVKSAVVTAAVPQPKPAPKPATPKPAVAVKPEPTEVAAPRPEGPTKPVALYPLDLEGAERAWQDWVLRHNIKASSMALGADGEILSTDGQTRSADAPYPIAGLSTSITAMCLNHVLSDTRFTWATSLSDLAPQLAQMNLSPHEGAQTLRLADIATHQSGFPAKFKVKNTSGEGRNLFTQQHFAREALTNPERQSAVRKHQYSNANYAVLGQVITALTGAPYSDTCAARVMQPAGAETAVVGGRMWATGGFGGWSASAEDMARFAMLWYDPRNPWVRAPGAFAFDPKSGAGLGVFHNINRKDHLIWHSDLWESNDPSRRHGAIFIISETGATFAANWQGKVERGVYKELREAIGPHLR